MKTDKRDVYKYYIVLFILRCFILGVMYMIVVLPGVPHAHQHLLLLIL